nr:MAG TPA: hypothetical protein [Caudoviricetes sp.]
MAEKPSRGNPPKDFGKTFSPEERRRNSSKGGIKSAEIKRAKKRTKEILELFLQMPLKKRKEAEIEDIQAFEQLKGKNITVNEAIQLRQVQRALNGDLNSAQYIRDSVGDKPSDTVNMNAEVKNPLKDLTTDELRKLIDDEDKS